MVGIAIRTTRNLYQELSHVEAKALALNKQNRKVKSYNLWSDVSNGRWSSNPIKYSNGDYYSEEVRFNVVKLFVYCKDIKGSNVQKTELKGFPYAD